MYLAIKIRDFPASNHVSFPGGGSYTVRIRRLNMETFKHEATFKNDISSRLPSFSTSKPLSFSGKKYLEPGLGFPGKKGEGLPLKNGAWETSLSERWWLNQPHLKNMLVKLDHFPK